MLDFCDNAIYMFFEMSIEKGITCSCIKYWFLCIFRLKNAKTKESI